MRMLEFGEVDGGERRAAPPPRAGSSAVPQRNPLRRQSDVFSAFVGSAYPGAAAPLTLLDSIA